MARETKIVNQGIKKLLKVLLIEDDINKQADIVDVLTEAGISTGCIHHENNVKCALASLKVNIYDLVVLDLCLPLRDSGGRVSKTRNDAGVTILKEIASGTYNTPQQIIGLTGYDDLHSEFSEQFQRLNFYLYKYDQSAVWRNALNSSLSWLQKGMRNRERKPTKKLVVTVHGIRTKGKWQEKLKEAVAIKEGFHACIPYKYRYFSFFKLFTRSKGNALDLFKSNLRDLFDEHPNSEVYIFAHSFGTYLVYEALQEMTLADCPKIKNIVFAGSVLRSDSRVTELANTLNIDRVINDCGRRDIPLLLSECFLKGMGMAGIVGFYGFTTERITQRKFSGGHSFFETAPDFYSKYWLPILDDQIVVDDVEFNVSNKEKDIRLYILHNVKYFVWLFIIVSFFLALLWVT